MASSAPIQAGLGLASWEIDFWGRVRSLNDAALRELGERLELAHQAIASRQESLRIFQRRLDVGSASRLNLTQVQTLLTQAQALGAQLEQARAQQANALALLGEAPVAAPAAAARLDSLSMPPLRAAQAQIGAARAAFFPRVALTGSLGLSGLSSDPRVLLQQEAGNERVQAALALYVRRIVREIGAMTAVLGGLDMLVFTAGIGEHNAASRVPVAVEPTNEEWIAAWRALALVSMPGH